MDGIPSEDRADTPSPGRPNRQNVARGRWGERLAAQHYRRAGYELLAQNWYGTDGEIDLIVRCGHIVVVCEVKARRTAAFGAPAEAVNHAKQRRLRRLAAEWLRVTATTASAVRFDVVTVTGVDVAVIEGAF